MTTRPETLDTHGVRHRHGCPMPGWTSDSPRIAGTHILRCPTCGAVRLVTTPNPTEPRP